MAVQSEKGLLQAYESLRSGNPERARTFLNEALQLDLDNPEILFMIQCLNFWVGDRLNRASKCSTPFESGETIVSYWKQFSALINDNSDTHHEKVLHAIRICIFRLALEYYQSMLKDHNTQGWEIFRKTGLCHKKLGDYETALKQLEKANSLVSDSAPILSEMADCYALCGEERTAKVLFREAFFIDAQKVDLSLLDSPLICTLTHQTADYGYMGQALQEWIPVYGVLLGIFTVKRELRALEIGKLKQTIYALENSLKETGSDPEILVPRLINHYFWLIDHCVTVHEDRARINETLLKIKLLNKDIYEKYTM